jgi:short-subunit dehydrogenase
VVHKNALITGASSGLGAAFARILPDSTHLLLTGRDEERLRRVADGLAGRADIIVADLASEAGRAAVIEGALARGIELLVCNAGLGWSGGFLEQPIARQREVISTNLVATIELLHALLPDMIARARHQERRAGVIIVSSMAALMPAPGLACYGASKAFALRLAQSLSAELAREPIEVLALCPTYTDTAFFHRAGLPEPRRAMAAEAVAREAMASLGRRRVHLCSLHRYPQALRRLAAFNPALAFWRWPRRLAALLQHPAPQPR